LPLSSMTGFARAEGRHADVAIVWEARSVNGKGLDLRLRLPPGWDSLEALLRAALGERLKRGNVSVTLSVDRTAAAAPLRLNREMLAQVLGIMRDLAPEIGAAPPRVENILAIRGILEAAEGEPETAAVREARNAAALALWREALNGLVAMRDAEGRRLGEILEERLAEIERLVGEAEASAAAQPEAIKARLRRLVSDLMEASPGLPEDRLAQEAALLVGKADVREELDRLKAHIAAARALLGEGGAVGRRLDFLCQEFNREANTLCSKSADLELTRVGLALKASIEQLREQVQNVE
jgi:uncharacterized protein (TIGR00255 family)